ncbi:MAG: LPXTG cell wall anchor domain-containing protein [Firmicutes bacterium]|nr:LPXTG cell wall anchor domain-containing protein [Bacillota bacterium]
MTGEFAEPVEPTEPDEPVLPETGTRIVWLIPFGLALLLAGALIRKRVAA